MLAATDPTLDPISDFAVDQDVREWHEPALGEAIVLYDPQTGEISVNTSQPLTTFEMRSGNRIFTGSPALNRDSPFDVDRDDKIFKLSTEGFGDLSFGEVAQVNYGQTALEQDLDFDGTFVDGAHPNFVLISAGNNDEAVIVNLSGITAGDDGPQPLSITAISDNTSLISDPFITYLSNDQTGRLAFSPLAGQHGVATITVMVEDGGPDLELNTSADNARFSRSFDVTINPPLVVNAPPTLDAIDTLNIDEGTVDQIVDLSGITAGGDDAQPLRVTATSNDLNLVNHPTISYRSGDSTGSLSITTVPDKNGTATIQVVVEDGGLDGDLSTTDDNAAVSRSFNVTVIPGNDPPTLTVAGLTMETPVSEDSCSISLDPTAFDVDAVGLLEDPGFAIAAPRMDESPIADGLIADGEYANQCFFTYAENENPGHSWPGLDNLNDGDADLTSRVHFAHTNESLFIAFDVTDDFLDLDPGSSVKNDGVELFINADLDSGDAWGPGKMQLYVDAFEGGTDLGLNNRGSSAGISAVSTIGPEAGEFYSAGLVREDGSGYVIEFEIPLASLDTAGGDGDRVPVTTGDFVLINAAVDDNDAGDNLNAQSGHHLLWHTAGASSPWGGGEKVWNVPLAFTESGKLVIDEDTPERTVELVGITAGGDESQPLRVTATSSDISLIDHPNVNYTSDDSTGSLILNPVGNQGGMATITVTVEDGGLDGDLSTTDDNATVARSFDVTVNPVNDPPTLAAAGLTMETPVSEDSCSISLDPTAFDVDAVGLLEDPGFAIAAPRMDESPIADGLIADGEYANQCFFTYAENENPGHSWPGLDNLNDGDADLTSRVHFAHTNESLFIAFDVTDDFLDLDPGSSVKNDGVELFINADLDSGDAWGPGKMQLYVDAFEGGTDLGLNNRGSSAGISAVSTIGPEAGEFYSAGLVREDGSGYVIEFEIPLASLDTAGGDGDRVPVTTGDFVLINAAVDDNDAGDNLNAQSGHHLLWHTAGASSPWGGGEKVWNVPLAFTESGKLVIDEDTPERTVELVGITAGGDESQPLRVTATSSDISLIDHPNVNYTSDDSTGSLILNPVGNQGGMATITVTVEDGGLDGDLDTINDNDSSSIELEVTVKVRNKQPTLDAIDNLAIAEDAIEQMINFSGVTAGAGESQSIKVTAASDNEGLISDPFVSYTSGNSTGRLIFSPVADQSGTAIITVSVEDSGLDGDLDTSADNAVFSRSFEVFVNPINDAPTLDVLADLGLNVGSGPQVMDLAGITAGPGESQPLRVTALSNAVNLVAHPTVGYTSDNTTGTFLITPIGAESGTATITVTVEDGGLDGDLSTSADNARFSRTMQVAIYPTGDLTRDGKLDADDIDAICPLINANANVADLNNDDSIDNKDFVYLVRDLIGSDFGDANLDGQFDSSDLVQIFVAGEYDDGVSGNSGWAEGDWTCDGEFDSSDLVAAFLSGSYVSPATPAAVDGALSLPTPESLLSEPSLQQADELADDGTIRLADPWAPTALEELAVVDQLFDQSEDDPAPWLADSADELELDWTV